MQQHACRKNKYATHVQSKPGGEGARQGQGRKRAGPMQNPCASFCVFVHADSISTSGKGLARPFPIITYNDCLAADLPDTTSPAASFNSPQPSHALSPTPCLGALRVERGEALSRKSKYIRIAALMAYSSRVKRVLRGDEGAMFLVRVYVGTQVDSSTEGVETYT